MGLQWDGTPNSTWMTAKIFAEYGVLHVNSFVRKHSTDDIPRPIARMFARNLERAVEHLPKETLSDTGCVDCIAKLDEAIKPMLSTDELKNGRLYGSVPLAQLEAALVIVRRIFSHSYAKRLLSARVSCLASCNETTDDGFVDAWDSKNYDSPKDDPNVKITSWEDAKAGVYRELREIGWLEWETHESKLFSDLYFDGPYSGHIDGFYTGPDAKMRHLEAEIKLVKIGSGTTAG